MAVATRYQKKQGPDTRVLNNTGDLWPATVVVTVFLEGEEVGPVNCIQGAKLSDKGNVTYKGAIAGGWELDGEPTETLGLLSFVANGKRLRVGAEGVHQSSNRNPTVFHSGGIELRPKTGDPKGYSVRVRATYSVKEEAYSLYVDVWPVAPGPRGPQVIGSVGAGFTLRPAKKAAA